MGRKGEDMKTSFVKYKTSETKIIQIATTSTLLFALTDDGQLYTTNAKSRNRWVSVQVPKGYKLK